MEVGMASKTWVRAITLAAAVGLLIPMAVIGQSRGGTATPPPTTGTGGTTGSAGATTGRTPTPSSTTTNPTTSPTGTITPPIFVSGRVVFEDGTAPAEQVVIETVCNGSPHAE